MFRISKSNDHLDDRDPDSEAVSELPAEESGGSVAASALRWLRRSKPPGEAPDSSPERDAGPVALDMNDLDDPTDDLELTDRIEAQGPDDPEEGAEKAAGQDAAGRAASPEPTSAALVSPAPPASAVPAPTVSHPQASPRPLPSSDDQALAFFDFDDDDDIDDFDELDLFSPPEPSPAAPERPQAASPMPDIGPRPGAVPEASPTSKEALQKPAAAARRPAPKVGTGAAPVARTSPASPVDDGGARDAGVPRKLDEASIAPLDTSLSLQPIPEFQPNRSPLLTKSGKRGNGAAASPLPDTAAQTPAVDPAADDDPAPDVSASEAEPVDILAFETEGFDLDAFDDDEESDADGDDWHAHLAEVLTGEVDGKRSPEPASGKAAAIPLAAVATSLPASSLPETEDPELEDLDIEDDAPMPMGPAVRPSHRRSAVASDGADLSPEALLFRLASDVPWLGRFAAAQIGDEPEADRLVQLTIKTALADPGLAEQAGNLRLTLLKLLYQERQAMRSSAALGRLPEEARAFEDVLCKELAGADQFEVRQFAVAINGLDEPDREILLLTALENLTYRQIAEVTLLPVEQVMANLAQARMRLRHALITGAAGAEAPSPAKEDAHPQEFEIHGYLDGELDLRHMAVVDALVEHDESAADRLLHYGIQGDLIRRLYAALLHRPIPAAVLDAFASAFKSMAASRNPRRGFGLRPRRALLAGAVVIMLGGGATSALLDLSAGSAMADGGPISQGPLG